MNILILLLFMMVVKAFIPLPKVNVLSIFSEQHDHNYDIMRMNSMRLHEKKRIVFLGSHQGAFRTLELLYKTRQKLNVDIVAAITSRPTIVEETLSCDYSPVYKYCKSVSIPVTMPYFLNSRSILEDIIEYHPDIIVNADYAKVLPNSLLKTARKGAVTIYPGLISESKIEDPIREVLLSGEPSTGVTLLSASSRHSLEEAIASETIILEKRTPLMGGEKYPDVLEGLFAVASELLVENFQKIVNGTLAVRNISSSVSYLFKSSDESNVISFRNMTATQIKNHIRANYGGIGTFAYFGKAKKKKRLLLDAYVESDEPNYSHGNSMNEAEVVDIGNMKLLKVSCCDGSILTICDMQRPSITKKTEKFKIAPFRINRITAL